MRRLLVAAALALLPAAAMAAPATVTGRWLTAGGKAVVEIAPCGGALCGRITRIGGPNRAAMDTNNPDKSLRGRPIEGLAILTGFHPASDRWKGQIYDPESGRTYRAELTRAGPILKVKGCWGPFCRTQNWAAAR